MYKVVFSDKPITEIKKNMHIDTIFTYSDSEIALKVCRNKQRFKFSGKVTKQNKPIPFDLIFDNLLQLQCVESFCKCT